MIQEDRLSRLLVDHIEDHAIFAVAQDGTVQSWTPSAERLLGYSVAEMIGQSAERLLIPEDARSLVLDQELSQAAASGRSVRDGWFVRRDESRLWVRAVTVPVPDQADSGPMFALILTDRSEWWQAVEGQRQTSELYQSALDHSVVGLAVTEISGRFLEANPVFTSLVGYSLAELQTLDRTDLTHPDDLAASFDLLTQLIAGQIASFIVEKRYIRADGQIIWVRNNVSPIRDSRGQPLRLVTITEPISVQKRAEASIAERTRLAEYARVVNLSLTSGTTLPAMLDRAAQASVDYLDAAFARIWAVDKTGQFLDLQASAGMYTHLDGPHQRVPIGQFKIGKIASSREPHLTNNVVGDPLVPAQDWARREGMVSFAGYPLVVDDRVVGVLGLFARHPLSDLTLQAMQAVADGIALGIDRKLTEDRLDEERQWLRVTLASIGDGLIATDTQGRINFLNEVAETLTGWSQAEATGRPMAEVFQIINEETREPVEPPVGKVLREGRIVGLANHTILIARDGTETAIEDSAAPIRAADGTIIGVVMVFRDATEERRHAAALRASEQEFRQMAGAITQLAWMAEPDGHISWYNQRWYDYTGTTFQEMQGWGWRSVHDPALVGGVEARFRDALAGGEPFDMVFPLRGADGVFRPFLTRMLPIRDEAGQIVRWVGTNTDISEQRRVEDETRAAKEEAETANKAKDHFLAILSHELRTPLNPILLATTSMLELPPEPEEIRATLKMIRQNVLLQSRLIDDLLDVMRIVRGKMPLHWEVADGHRLIQQSQQICQSEVFGKQLHTVMDLQAHDHHINADPARLQQVFWNLIKNAVKFTPSGGTITIRSRNEVVAGVKQLIVTISDTGIGIDPAVLPLVFDPFQQGEKEITRKFGGLGLGLAICKGIIESHGGTISVTSAGAGQGTTFQITLGPLPEQMAIETTDQPPGTAPANTPPVPASLRILLVEDEPATMRIMARLLKRLGHTVTAAGSIAAALSLIETEDFDLIISDIGLPDGTGLDLMRRVTKLHGAVPAIALTGYGMEEDILRSRAAGFTAHMTKPIDFTKLEVMIRQVAPGAG